MIFWIIISGLALGVGGILSGIMLRGRAGGHPSAAYDLQVYRDQLRDIDRDLDRGVIAPDEAERVRAEVSRRILAADAQLSTDKENSGLPHAQGKAAAALAVLVVLAGALLLYQRIGVPGYRDFPIAARLAASDAARATRPNQAQVEAQSPPPQQVTPDPEFAALMKALRQTVKDRPEDPQGLELLARNEAALGNLTAAHSAFARLIDVKGPKATADDYAFLADLMVSAASGVVSSDAEAALRKALEMSPGHPLARYYMGLYLMQVDRPDVAFRIWEQLLHDSTGDAPWVSPIRAQIEGLAQRAGVRYTLPPLSAPQPGPEAGDNAAAKDMTPEDQAAMIRSMVDRLSDRLNRDGGPPEDWARLMQALVVLGEGDRALIIYTEAKKIFADVPDALDLLQARAQSLGMPE